MLSYIHRFVADSQFTDAIRLNAPQNISEMAPLNLDWKRVGLLASCFCSKLIIFCNHF